MELRGDDEEFDRDYDEDLTDFKVGNVMNNLEDDLAILDSLPSMAKPKGLANSFGSKSKGQHTSVKNQLANGKGEQN